MRGKDLALKHKMIKAMAEARLLNEKEDYFMSELDEDEQKVLKELDKKYQEGYDENASLTDRLGAIIMLGSEEEARVYSDLLSKAMGGETSGDEDLIDRFKKSATQVIDPQVMAAKEAGKKLRELPNTANKKEIVAALKGSGAFKSGAKVSLSGCNNDTASSVARSLGGFIEDFPFMHGVVGGIQMGEMKMSYGNCTSFEFDYLSYSWKYVGKVRLSSTYYQSKEVIQKQFEYDVSKGFHPKGTEADAAGAVITHELGHALDAYVSEQLGYMQESHMKFSEYIRDRVAQRLGTNKYDLPYRVSGYAARNSKEYFAESLSELKHSASPRQEAVVFGEELFAALKEGGLL